MSLRTRIRASTGMAPAATRSSYRRSGHVVVVAVEGPLRDPGRGGEGVQFLE